MNKIEEIRRYINVIKRAVAIIESKLDDDGGLLEQLDAQLGSQATAAVSSPIVAEVDPPTQPITDEEWNRHLAARAKHIQDLLSIDCWPEAVPPFLVANDASTDDQVNRANAVLDMMVDRPLTDMSFLDFGCGDGWIANEAVKRGVSESIGFDIIRNNNWSNLKSARFTHIYDELKPDSYDAIMLYDVLDHCESTVLLMSQIKKLLKPNGVVYVRCHPWTSKHGSHVYKQGLNKAYIHLFLDPEELQGVLGQKPMFTRKELNPIEAYRWWFKDFEIKRERLVTEPVNQFFKEPSFKELLATEHQISFGDIDSFLKIMETQFVDYTLVNKK